MTGQFPGLNQEVRGKRLVYLDNAASSQIVKPALDALNHFQLHDRANVHRGVHTLSQRATLAFDGARPQVAKFLGVTDEAEVIFTAGTTASLNLVAQTWGRQNVDAGDDILVSEMEHHSNIVPWQMLAAEKGANIRVIPMDERGVLDLNVYHDLLGPRAKVVALVHASNALGTVNPVAQMAEMARARGAVTVVDGAQMTPHGPVDVEQLGCDFYAMSGHKMYAPTGVGVLWGRRELLEAMPPWQGGGDMIRTVSFSGTTYADLPNKFEAGTPHIGGVIGFGAAVAWMLEQDWDAIRAHEADLLAYATAKVEDIDGMRIVGTAPDKVAVLSFVLDAAHAHDVGTILDMEGVAVRTGHHCAQPVMDHFGVPATARASFALYNTREDVDALFTALHRVMEMFGGS